MADVVVAFSNIKQGVEASGQRSVTATLDFDTGDYVTGGVPIVLSSLGLKVLSEAYQVAYAQRADPSTAYTQAVWQTAQDTVTYNYFVDIDGTGGTPQAPLLVIFSAGNVLSGAVAASAQVRIKFVGS